MPRFIVKVWPGKSEQQKTRLAEELVDDKSDKLYKKPGYTL